MRRRTLGVKKEPTIMIIPMIDIVFFLLVFFMVGTLYMNTEQQIPLNLPSTSTSTAKSIEPIIITLTTSHKLYIDNREISADNLKRYRISCGPRHDRPLLFARLRTCIITRSSPFSIC